MYHQIIKIILLSFLLSFFSLCKDKSRVADEAPPLETLPSFSGEWKLELALSDALDSDTKPSSISSVLVLDPDSKKANLGEEEYSLEMDSLGVRIRPSDRENAVGYFLYSEIKEKTWVGTWDDRVVRLIRQ